MKTVRLINVVIVREKDILKKYLLLLTVIQNLTMVFQASPHRAGTL